MKKITMIISVLLFVQMGLFISPQASNTSFETISFSFHTEKPILIQDEEYISIGYTDQDSYLFKPGHPHLPVVKKHVVLPFGSTIESIEFSSQKIDEDLINKPLKPCETPLPISEQKSSPLFIPDETIYQQDMVYPEKPYEVTMNTGLYEGVHVSYLTIEFYPIQYHPSQQKLIYTKGSEISVTIKQGKVSFSSSDSYDLAIVCPDRFVDDIQVLENHKDQHGVKTLVKTTEEIYDEYTGRDNSEQIKYCLYDLVKNQGIKYVLLIGDVNVLPMRGTDIAFYNDDEIITDLYYADVFDGAGGFSSWDSNGNDKFGEYTWSDGMIDIVDVYPDVSVGRIPCSDRDEVKTIVDKIITYENSAAYQSWFNRILLLGGDTFPNHGVLEGELVTNIIADSMVSHQFVPVKLWTSTNNYNPLRINKEINNGAGFISYSGHGYEQGFGTSPPNVEKRIQYFSPYIIGLLNSEKLPIIFFDACSTTKLDFTVEDALYWYPTPLAKFFVLLEGESYQMDTLFPCLSWQLLKKQNGGCIANIGATRVAFTGVDETGPHWGAGLLNNRFFENYASDKALGDMFNDAQVDYIQSVGYELITLEEFILVGDPSLSVGGFS